jgi:hypothetical protein
MIIRNQIKLFFYLVLIIGIIGVLIYYESFKKGNLKFRIKVSMVSNSIKLIWYETKLAFKN